MNDGQRLTKVNSFKTLEREPGSENKKRKTRRRESK